MTARRLDDWHNYPWRTACLKRDNYTCQRCGKERDLYNGIKICVHHKADKSRYPEIDGEIDNGISLCRLCHDWIHAGAGREFRLQLEQDVLQIFGLQDCERFSMPSGKLPIGYMWNPDKTQVMVDIQKSHLIERMFMEFAQTSSYTHAAKVFPQPKSPGCIRKLLSTNAYRGSMTWANGPTYITPKFMDDELLRQVDLLLDHKKRNCIGRAAKTIFQGMVLCPSCRNPLRLMAGRRKYKGEITSTLDMYCSNHRRRGTCEWHRTISVKKLGEKIRALGIPCDSRIHLLDVCSGIIMGLNDPWNFTVLFRNQSGEAMHQQLSLDYHSLCISSVSPGKLD